VLCDHTGGASNSYQLTALVRGRTQETPSTLTQGTNVIDRARCRSI